MSRIQKQLKVKVFFILLKLKPQNTKKKIIFTNNLNTKHKLLSPFLQANQSQHAQ